MNGKGSNPREQAKGPDGKTPQQRFVDNWEATFGGETLRPLHGYGSPHGRHTACGLPYSGLDEEMDMTKTLAEITCPKCRASQERPPVYMSPV